MPAYLNKNNSNTAPPQHYPLLTKTPAIKTVWRIQPPTPPGERPPGNQCPKQPSHPIQMGLTDQQNAKGKDSSSMPLWNACWPPLITLLETRHPLFRIEHSLNPNHTQAGGVSIIINFQIIKTEPTNVKPLIPGRALRLTIEWPKNTWTQHMLKGTVCRNTVCSVPRQWTVWFSIYLL